MNPVSAARELQPIIRKYLGEGEKEARLVNEVFAAVGQAGLFRLFAPHEVGGLEVSPAVALAAIEAVSAADPAVGWCIGNSQPACLAAGWLAEDERARLFAEPHRNFGFSAAPAGRAVAEQGGYRLSGQWPVVTGCEDASWCALAGLVMDGETPRQVNGVPDGRLFLIPTADLVISPTWRGAAAMRGTGSHAVSVDQVFVPEGFAHTPAKPRVIDRPLYRLPLPLLFAPAGVAVALGALDTAVASAREALGAKVSSFSGQTIRDQTPIQELIAHSSAALRAARAGLLAATNAVWELASRGAGVPLPLRAELYASTFYVLDTARDTVSHLYARGTRAGFMQGNPLERALRNLHAIAFGYESSRGLQHSAGRVLLGGEPLDPLF
ncbi:MAG: acyl-CoA dehydrogenase family protein [Desulfurellaceae bacterium]|nr:acyl-CoA dehydrogenase family protein [Desulfurellaceae bacterium]